MKKIVLCLMVACLSLTFHPFQSKAATVAAPSSSVVTSSVDKAKANVLLPRLNDIYKMDKSKLNPQEKRNLRNEVLVIRHQLNDWGGGLYISGGALIIIIILLIILL